MPDIVKKVFADHGIADFKLELTGTYRKWTYCVQYRETDFNFVSRLMEHEGIYYYFKHDDGQHTLVLTDSYERRTTPLPGYAKRAVHRARSGWRGPDIEHISSWEFSREVAAGRVRARRLRLRAAERRAAGRRRRCRASYAPSDYEVYDYPGRLRAEAGRRAVRRRAHRRVRSAVRGARTASTNARGVERRAACSRSTSYPRDDQNREYLDRWRPATTWSSATTRRCRDAAAPDYRCSFAAMSTQAAVPAAAHHAQAVRAGPADGGRRRPGRRRDLHRQVRPREGAVPLGPLRQEEREQLVLDPRVAAVGRQGLGRRSRSRASARK